ncbi:MAG: hypothetical protein OXI24_02900, partial [Candidatus Poribacteria bacterium]|nr:hypothetical protein [Candidatus Poribacteria bacterium]
MAKGSVYPSESRSFYDRCTGTHIRQITTASALHHHPFFIIPAYDNAMQRMIFISYRTGTAQIFVEERATGELRQLTDRPDISEWSVHPGRNGKAVFFTAGTSGWRLDLETLEERELVDFTATTLREEGMVAAALTAMHQVELLGVVRTGLT